MNERLAELIDWASVEGNRTKRHRVIETNGEVIDTGATLDGKKKPTNRLMNNSKNPKYHSSHRLAFSFEYSGTKITKGKVSKFGRYCNSNPSYRYRLDYPEYNARVFAYARSLLIWIKKPKGRLTVEQLIEARKLARECSQAIAFKFRVMITREKGAGFSEHIVISKPLDKILRPLVQAEPDLMRERCGITENIRSHPGKLEHHDRNRRPEQPRAKDRVMVLENVLEGKTATKEDIKELREDIRAIVPELRELTATLKDVVLGSIKPPEKPPEGIYG